MAHVGQLDTGLNEGLGVRSDLAMHLGRMPDLGVNVAHEAVLRPLLGRGLAIRVRLQRLWADFPLGILAPAEQILHGNGWGLSLAVFDVVVGEGPLSQQAAVGLQGGSANGTRLGSACSLLLFLFLLFLFLLSVRL